MANKERLIERFVAENVPEAIWLRLRRLTSTQLCKKIITERSPSLCTRIIEKKSTGMASAVRSALGYWDAQLGGLNSRILSRYYALLQITIAEQVSSGNAKDDLGSVQRHTEYGHGLFSINANSGNFPDSFYIGCLNSGDFPAYCQHLGRPLKSHAHGKRPRSFEDADPSKLYSLRELLRRVPELQNVCEEYLNVTPLSFHIGHASRNMEKRLERQRAHAAQTGQLLFDPPVDTETVTTYVAVYPHGNKITAEELNGFGFPIKNIKLELSNRASDEEYFVGELTHPKKDIWWDHIDTYKSGYSGTSLVVPFWEIIDPMVLHLSILYAFSIVVRYLPETWQEIEHGQWDHIRSLLEHYLVVVDNVLPKLSVERLTGKTLIIGHPGGLNSPV